MSKEYVEAKGKGMKQGKATASAGTTAEKQAIASVTVQSHDTEQEALDLYKELTTRHKVQFYKVGKSGQVFVRYPSGNGTELSPLESEDFKCWLYNATGEKRRALVNLIFEIKAKAIFDTMVPTTEIFTRLGFSDGKIYLDLCNDAHQVVEIKEQGWDIIKENEAPVLFMREENMEALPVPQHDGSLKPLRDFVNVDDKDFQFVIGWLVAALNPRISSPILWINAAKGRGKTTLTKWMKRLVDPDTAGALAPFERADDLYAACSSRYVLAIDNVSKVSGAWSDHYCRLVTGASVVRRRLYRDNKAANVQLRNALIINGISCIPAHSDLEDRCFLINLLPLNETNRKQEQVLDAAFEKNHPFILGALLEAVSAALKDKEYIPKVDVRMIDAVAFIMKAAKAGALPFNDEEFARTLMAKKEQAEDIGGFDDPLASIIYDEVNAKRAKDSKAPKLDIWFGPTRDLLKTVRARATGDEKKSLPQDARSLGKRIFDNEFLATMKSCGVVIEKCRTNTDRQVKITYISPGEPKIQETMTPLSDDPSNAIRGTENSESDVATAAD